MARDRNFTDLLTTRWRDADTMLCVGLDPDITRLPVSVSDGSDPVMTFLTAIIDATAEYACAFKPQVAHFAANGDEAILERLIQYVKGHHPTVPIILDAKRGDIGSTASHYAREAFERYGADAVTVNPYLGGDALEPFLADPARGVIVLCRTSNPGSGDFQALIADDRPIYLHVAERAANEWNANGNCALVVGATWPDELAAARSVAPQLPILVPGIGAQGGDLAAAVAGGRDATGYGLIINASRSILYASAGDDFAAAAATSACALRDAIRGCCM